MQAVAVFQGPIIKGIILFIQKRGYVEIEIEIEGLEEGLHGAHIHNAGDLRKGCDSCCSHYNPENNFHGGLNDVNSHAGDLGNIEADNDGHVTMVIQTSKFKVKDIFGRSMIIHEDEDDLGKGRTKESKQTGTSGKRIACAVIGRVEC